MKKSKAAKSKAENGAAVKVPFEANEKPEESIAGKEKLQSINAELTTINQELKKKIEELSESNSDFQNLIISTDIGTIFLDSRLRVKMFTPLVGSIFNLPPTDLNRPLSDLTTQLNYENLSDDCRLVIKNLQTIEREIPTRDDRWFLVRILPYRLSQNLIRGVILTFLDITERKMAQDKFRKSEEGLRIAVEAAEMGTWNWDLHTNEVEWNGRHFELFGMKEENPVAPEDFFRHVHADDREWVRARLDKTVRGKTLFEVEFRAVLESGEVRWMNGYGQVVEQIENQTTRVSGVMLDITERKLAEKALRESEERSRLLIEGATDFAIFKISPENTVETWNAGAERVFGWKENDIIGQSGAVLFTPEDRTTNEPEKEIETARKNGRAEDERWHIRGDGSRFYASGVLMRLDEGEAGFVKIARDHTGKIVTEKALRDKEILQKIVAGQEDERKRIARDLHDELGQQLTALRLKLEAARKICENEAVCGKIDEIQTIARQIDADVGFLAWELRPASLDDLGLAKTLENYVAEWSKHAGVTGEFQALGIKDERFAPEVETNLYRITQEAVNNAHKHAAAKTVSVMLEKRGASIVLIVEDDGEGFDAEDKATRGKGIGLIGMQERAALVGGALEIESARGQGTTIFARVPFIEQPNRSRF